MNDRLQEKCQTFKSEADELELLLKNINMNVKKTTHLIFFKK
jgi:hypothetical protein